MKLVEGSSALNLYLHSDKFSRRFEGKSRKKLMMGTDSAAARHEGSALLSQYASQNNENKQGKGRPWCDHCQLPGHTQDTCWKIQGKPVDWKPKKKESKRNTTSTKSSEKPTFEPAFFSKEQEEWIQKLVSQNSSSNYAVATENTVQKVPF